MKLVEQLKSSPWDKLSSSLGVATALSYWLRYQAKQAQKSEDDLSFLKQLGIDYGQTTVLAALILNLIRESSNGGLRQYIDNGYASTDWDGTRPTNIQRHLYLIELLETSSFVSSTIDKFLEILKQIKLESSVGELNSLTEKLDPLSEKIEKELEGFVQKELSYNPIMAGNRVQNFKDFQQWWDQQFPPEHITVPVHMMGIIKKLQDFKDKNQKAPTAKQIASLCNMDLEKAITSKDLLLSYLK